MLYILKYIFTEVKMNIPFLFYFIIESVCYVLFYVYIYTFYVSIFVCLYLFIFTQDLYLLASELLKSGLV